MKAIELIWKEARQYLQHIVLPEGDDPRTVVAADKLIREKLAKITVLGPVNKVQDLCREHGINADFDIIDPAKSEFLDDFARQYQELRKNKKPVTQAEARQTMLDGVGFGAMMIRSGHADGSVAGSIHTSADILRAAFRILGVSPDVKIASSFSLLQLPTNEFGCNGALIYADTAVIPNPDAEELADIAVAAAETARDVLHTRPKIAMISYSTKGSARHHMLDKIVQATEIARKRMAAIGLEADIDGEMQADAALIPAICARKAPGSPIAGMANTLVFPDLNVGNTCYKITERIGHAAAYGPILQGLNHPASDLSRGCSADDIVSTAAIVACQAISLKQACGKL